MLHINDLTYSYTQHTAPAVSNARGVVEPGIWLLLGPNGAGKTTLLNLIATLFRPDKGDCTFDGAVMQERRPSLLRRIFFVPDTLTVPTATIEALAKCDARFYPNFSSEVLAENLRAFGLTGREKLADQSLGQRRKAYIAYSLSLGVDLLLLDEPANGLDIDSKKVMRQMMARCVGPDQTVIISTHNIADLRELYDGLMVMQSGHLTMCSSSARITSKISFRHTQLPVPDAIYNEQSAGIYHSLVRNTTGETTDIDYTLLYSALMSPKGQEISWMIHPVTTNETEK
ncbi:MAG: ATP-binding cassette domain-containing protein [Muribaculaceae bacterium]|nr:ATP-binding cassette domain-containing protein [Muribaculaceae bacterium]